MNAGLSWGASGDLAEAETSLENTRRAFPYETGAAIELSNVYMRMGKFDSAELLLRDLARDQPSTAQIYIQLASLYEKVGQLRQAEATLLKGCELFPEHRAVQERLGYFYLSLDRLWESERAFLRLGDLKEPTREEDYQGLIEVYLKMRQPDAALAVCQKALLVLPRSALLLAWAGTISLEQGRHESAEHYFRLAEKIGSRDPVVVMHLAAFYRENKEYDRAREQLLALLSGQPRHFGVLMALGELAAQSGEYEQAEGYFRQAVSVEPADVGARCDLARVCLRRNHRAAAREALEQVWEQRPDAYVIAGMLGTICERQGDNAAADIWFNRADRLRAGLYNPLTARNYLRLYDLCRAYGARLVCVQYPMRQLSGLRRVLAGRAPDAVFVDNREAFRAEVRRRGYDALFNDAYAGEFGSTTVAGSELLAGRIAEQILEMYRGRGRK